MWNICFWRCLLRVSYRNNLHFRSIVNILQGETEIIPFESITQYYKNLTWLFACLTTMSRLSRSSPPAACELLTLSRSSPAAAGELRDNQDIAIRRANMSFFIILGTYRVKLFRISEAQSRNGSDAWGRKLSVMHFVAVWVYYMSQSLFFLVVACSLFHK